MKTGHLEGLNDKDNSHDRFSYNGDKCDSGDTHCEIHSNRDIEKQDIRFEPQEDDGEIDFADGVY